MKSVLDKSEFWRTSLQMRIYSPTKPLLLESWITQSHLSTNYAPARNSKPTKTASSPPQNSPAPPHSSRCLFACGRSRTPGVRSLRIGATIYCKSMTCGCRRYSRCMLVNRQDGRSISLARRNKNFYVARFPYPSSKTDRISSIRASMVRAHLARQKGRILTLLRIR